MAMSEVDSFFYKFKQLLHCGRKAHLEMKSEAGKAVIHLTAEVDVNEDDHHRAQPRNGPARQRRRENELPYVMLPQLQLNRVELILQLRK
jgi:hypothetical protein